jgi:hypothetical protein
VIVCDSCGEVCADQIAYAMHLQEPQALCWKSIEMTTSAWLRCYKGGVHTLDETVAYFVAAMQSAHRNGRENP